LAALALELIAEVEIPPSLQISGMKVPALLAPQISINITGINSPTVDAQEHEVIETGITDVVLKD
jgi:hypothetical protein